MKIRVSHSWEIFKKRKSWNMTFLSVAKWNMDYGLGIKHGLGIKCGLRTSLETQGQSVGSVERAGRKFSSTGEGAPRYRLSPTYFQKFRWMPAPDWAQKNYLYHCAQSANSFSWILFVSSYTAVIVSPHLPGSFTKLVRAIETFNNNNI